MIAGPDGGWFIGATVQLNEWFCAYWLQLPVPEDYG
jgi:hypothetical protein